MQGSMQFLRRPITVGVISVALISGAVFTYFISQNGIQNQPAIASDNSAEIKTVMALGRLEPEGEVIRLSVTESSGSTRVAKLLVKQGEQVQGGQVIAILDSRDRLAAALEQAKQKVMVAEAQLVQVKAGAKSGEIQAQKAAISRLQAELRGQISVQAATVGRTEAELRNAEAEYQRYQSIYQDGAVSASTRDTRRLTLETAQERLKEAKATQSRTIATIEDQLKEARETLNRIAEVRPVDVQVAQAEVESAIAAVKEAEANLALSYVRSPRSGQILKVHTKSGEVIGNQTNGIVELGNTNQMYAVAEVYQSDIKQVKLGQTATITSNAFAGELQGTVSEVGLQIAKKDVLGTDPAADQDARVIEVKIRLTPKASKVVSGLTNLQMKVAIAL